MELQVEQVQRALQSVAGACNPRHNSEVLQHVLLRATVNGVHVVASDNEVTAIAVVTLDRKSTRLNSSHEWISRMPSSA